MPIIAGRASAAYGAGFGAITTPPYEGPFGAYDALATVTVPSGGLASITFGGIPQGYRHLQIRGMVRMLRAEKTDDVYIRFNNDTAANYSTHLVGGVSTGGSPYTYNGANGTLIFHYEGFPGATTTANTFAGAVWDIVDYSSQSKNKTLRAMHGFNSNGDTKSLIQIVSGNWRNATEGIATIQFTPAYGTGFAQYSQFALYGVK
jgi:hypothetical protein